MNITTLRSDGLMQHNGYIQINNGYIQLTNDISMLRSDTQTDGHELNEKETKAMVSN